MEAISKMSYLHAKYFDESGGISQFRTKGRVQVVFKDSKVQKVFPGKPIRFPVLASGRLDQIEIEPRTFDPNQ
jgi:N-acyl-D-glutamate deacylase